MHGLVIYCREENDRNDINGNDVVFLIIKWVYELIFDFSLGMCKTTARCPLIPSAQQIQEVRKSMQYKIKQPDLTQIAAESEYIWKVVIWITLGHFHKITLPSWDEVIQMRY